jgi:hypothetical protein
MEEIVIKLKQVLIFLEEVKDDTPPNCTKFDDVRVAIKSIKDCLWELQ